MLRRIISWKLGKAEAEIGGSLDYARHIAKTSLRAFLVFTKVLPVAEYRQCLPAAAAAVARLVATRDEDCGSCLQIEVNLARKARVPRETLQAVLDRRPDALPAPLGDVYRFAEAVVTASGAEDPLRESLRRAYGEEGLVELSLGMAACRFFPIVKRGLGYATSCGRTRVEVPA